MKREKSQGREMDGLDSKYAESQALRDPSQDRYDDQRSGNMIVIRSSKIKNSQGTFKGKPT